MKILVIGSINYDFVTTTKITPKLGETQLGLEFNTFHGGKGANQAVAASRFGGDVTMLGCVGNDSIGTELLKHLKEEGINTEKISVVESSSGVANIIVENGDNRIIVIPGANGHVNEKLLTYNKEFIKGFDIVLLQNEVDHTVLDYICLNKQDDFILVYNPAPFKEMTQFQIDCIDYITPNETEYAELLKCGLEIELEKLIITCGEKGVMYKNTMYPAPKVKAIDTTGAGDTFNGVLVAMLSKGYSIESAIETSVKAASVSVTKHGAQSGMPREEEV